MKNLRVAGGPAEILAKRFPNTSLDCYRYISLLCDSLVGNNELQKRMRKEAAVA
jgi:hypothetical protein